MEPVPTIPVNVKTVVRESNHMKKKTFTIAATVGLAACVASSFGQVLRPGDAIPGQYLIQIRGTVLPQTVSQRHGVIPSRFYNFAANGFAGFIPPGLLRQLERDPDVLSIVPNRVVAAIGKPEKPGKPGGGGGGTTQETPAGVVRIGAAGLALKGGGVGVAVMDTGIDSDHPDLIANYGASLYDPYDNDGEDRHGHGTHVAGIIAAADNQQDVVGVAPEATLYSVRVLDSTGAGSDEVVIAGLEAVLANAHRVQVANLSLGRPGSLDDNPLLREAFQEVTSAGVTVVVAAGNDCGLEVSQQVPAGYPEVIAVASTTARDGKANRKGLSIPADTASYFSTDGAFNAATGIGVTISAPGETQEDVTNGGFAKSVGILSTALGGGTTQMSGTSMAAPHVAGAAALLLQASPDIPDLDPDLRPGAVRTALMLGADVVGKNGDLPYVSPTSCQSGNDGDSEGILWVPGALAEVAP